MLKHNIYRVTSGRKCTYTGHGEMDHEFKLSYVCKCLKALQMIFDAYEEETSAFSRGTSGRNVVVYSKYRIQGTKSNVVALNCGLTVKRYE